MKVLLSSSRGASKTRSHGHRARDQGKPSSGRKESSHLAISHEREGKNSRGDSRFAARFTDPRFKISKQLANQHSNTLQKGNAKKGKSATALVARKKSKSVKSSPSEPKSSHRTGVWDELEKTKQDPRFAKHFQDPSFKENVEEEEEEEDEKDENILELEEVEEERDVCEWADDGEYIDPRKRLAIVNCDWDHVRAVDLYALLFHGLPLGGELLEVCVYKSDFGKKMMEHEKVHGPDLWVLPSENRDTSGEESSREDAPNIGQNKSRMSHSILHEEDAFDSEQDENVEDNDEGEDDGRVNDDPSMLEGDEEGENGEFFSSGKYRQYEFNRMKYYYAVAVFDSSDTAAAVYQEMDGVDIEASGVILDLRYIDDSETFSSADLVSRADHIPASFKPLNGIRNPALSQTRFRISWDQEDPVRHHCVQDLFSGTTPEDDLAAYLATSESDSEDDCDTKEEEEDGGTVLRRGKPERNDTEEKILSKSERRKRTRQLIRHRYAALLEEIGADPNEKEEESIEKREQKGSTRHSLRGNEVDESTLEEESTDGDEKDDVSLDVADEDRSTSLSSLDSDDDNDLNRFSDIDDEDMDEEMGVEATLDLNADDKATALQKQTRVKRQLASGTLSEKAEVKYKLRRKAAKKLKKETVRHERESEKAKREMNEDMEKKILKSLLGEEEGAARIPGKERRKAHAKEVKAKVSAQREERKRARTAHLLGVKVPNAATTTVSAGSASFFKSQEAEGERPDDEIDVRFQQKLFSDPRYHLDVAQRDKRVSSDVTAFAAKIAKAKRNRQLPSSAAGTGSKKGSTKSSNTCSTNASQDDAMKGNEMVDSAVEYFLHETPQKKRHNE